MVFPPHKMNVSAIFYSSELIRNVLLRSLIIETFKTGVKTESPSRSAREVLDIKRLSL